MRASDVSERPDPLKAHHTSPVQVPLGRMGLEFDHRIFWLKYGASADASPAHVATPDLANLNLTSGNAKVKLTINEAETPELDFEEMSTNPGQTPLVLKPAKDVRDWLEGKLAAFCVKVEIEGANSIKITTLAAGAAAKIGVPSAPVIFGQPVPGAQDDAKLKELFVMVNVAEATATVLDPSFPMFSPIPLLLPKFRRKCVAQVVVDDGRRSEDFDRKGSTGDRFEFRSDGDGEPKWRTDRGSGDGRPGMSALEVSGGGYHLTLVTGPRRPRGDGYSRLVDGESLSEGYVTNGTLGRAAMVVQPDLLVLKGDLHVDGTPYRTKLAIGKNKYEVIGQSWSERVWSQSGLGARTGLPQPVAWRRFVLQFSVAQTMIYQMWDPYTGRTIKQYAVDFRDDGRLHTFSEEFLVEPGETKRQDARAYHTEWTITRRDEGSTFGRVAGLTRIFLSHLGGDPWVSSQRMGFTHHHAEMRCEVRKGKGEKDPLGEVNAWVQQVSSDWVELSSGTLPGVAAFLEQLHQR